MGGDKLAALPGGRHGLSREEVVASQRERLLAAMVEVVGELGFAGVSVADVIRVAGVSRATFYEQFASKQECFAAAFEAAARETVELSLDGADGVDPVDRVDGALRAFLVGVTEHPARSRLLLVDVYAAGPELAERRAVLLQEAVDEIGRRLDIPPAEGFALQALAAAISTLVSNALLLGRPDAVMDLHAPLMALIRRAEAHGR